MYLYSLCIHREFYMDYMI